MKKSTAPYVIYGSSSDFPDVRYATSFTAPDGVLVIVDGRKTILVVSDMEYGRARSQAVGCKVECQSSLSLPPNLANSVTAWTMKALEKHGLGHVIAVGVKFPLGIARALEKNGITVDIAADNPIADARAIKKPTEIEAIAQVQAVARAAMKAAGRAIRMAEPRSDGVLMLDGKPLTSERVRAIVRRTAMERNCIDEGTIIAGGDHAVDPHEEGHGSLKAGEWIVCDIFPRSLETGYWGDMTRTFMNGRPTAAQRRMYNAVRDAQRLALGAIRAGVAGSAVHAAVARSLEDSGFGMSAGADGRPQGFIHSTGHGVGLEIHEEPRISPSGGRLRAGMVVSVEPGLYYSGLGGVRIEDLVEVRKGGVRIL